MLLPGCVAALASALAIAFVPQPLPLSGAATDALPRRLDEAAFWRLSGQLSEPEGYFKSADRAASYYQLMLSTDTRGVVRIAGRFCVNVSSLPMAAGATFVRSQSGGGGFRTLLGDMRAETRACAGSGPAVDEGDGMPRHGQETGR